MIGKTIRDFLPKRHLLSYLEAILRVYNEFGRRDNLFKSRIKILVHEIGAAEMARRVEEEWAQIRGGALDLPIETIAGIAAQFAAPSYAPQPRQVPEIDALRFSESAFAHWLKTNVAAHREPGYAIVTLSLKPEGGPPGDASAAQMDAVADLADAMSFGEIRVSHEQNLLLPHVPRAALPALWRALAALNLATPNAGKITDIICCPGLDYCSLANARSIPVGQRLTQRFNDLARVHDIGDLKIKMSGCINACGHHHVGHIGLLGVDKNGEEFYQITLGGSAESDASLGAILGPAVSSADVVDAVESVVETYLAERRGGERFLDTYRRVGAAPFKERLYAAA
jgi:sulfite reductase (NADPH) hemoprotein beta-component